MTAAERQKLERERNRRAREVVDALSGFSGSDWAERRELDRFEILNAIFLVSKWAREGAAAEEEWRITPPYERARIARAFERANMTWTPFCSNCGSSLEKDQTGQWQRCLCRVTKT
jgi:hypothetical protein